MEIIAFALLAAPDQFFHSQPWQTQLNIVTWLKAINEKEMPVTNWLWFRVMTNLALNKTCGVPFEEVQGKMNEDLDTMERFYLDEGWSADGIWDKNGRQADYYSGSFAIQFSQLLYANMARDLDPERCARFEERALAFASSFWRYFDSNGNVSPNTYQGAINWVILRGTAVDSIFGLATSFKRGEVSMYLANPRV